MHNNGSSIVSREKFRRLGGGQGPSGTILSDVVRLGFHEDGIESKAKTLEGFDNCFRKHGGYVPCRVSSQATCFPYIFLPGAQGTMMACTRNAPGKVCVAATSSLTFRVTQAPSSKAEGRG
jgi:hypothetical protein